MSTRSLRRTARVPEAGMVDPQVAKAHATAAASRAMRSSERSSTESKNSRRPNSSLQGTDDGFSVYSMPVAPPATPSQLMETDAVKAHVGKAILSPPNTDFKGLDGQDSSVPSSFRRLRKAKSMFSTRQRSSHIAYTAQPKSPRNALDLDRSPGFDLPRTLRPSISFIRGGNRQGMRGIRHAKSHDAAIQLARSQFLEESNGAGQTRRSSFFMSSRNREPRPFRKTFRITSDSGIGGVSPEQANFKRSRSRSRSFSASIKNGLKRVFGFSKPPEKNPQFHDESPSVVAQMPTIETRPVSANIVIDKNTSVDNWNRSNQLQPTQVSPDRDSICTSPSRVTSWADSTATNTVTTRKTGHRQSLSLIEEHGDLNLPLPQMPVSLGAENRSPNKRPSARRFNDWVNSHDLYTALMQQIGQNAVHDPEEDVIFGTVPEHRVIPERASSVHSHRSRRSVRHVQSGDSTPVSFATARRGDSQSPHRRPQPSKYVQRSRVSTYSPGQENCRPLTTHSVKKSPVSAFIIDEHSDESTGSVVVAQLGDLNQLSRSSSVYSRSTGGDPSTKHTSASGGEALDSYGEPGTVTIFASERHSSPTRKAGSKAQVQPSTDWQQWMSSQIERIESTNPAREHVRETSQCQEDEDGYFMGMIRRAPVLGSATVLPYVEGSDGPVCGVVQIPAEAKSSAQSNFSRPFSHSSSVRTILSSQRIEPSFATIESINPSDANVNANRAEDSSPILENFSNDHPLSPIRVRTANLRDEPESPTPQRNGAGSQKRTWTQDQYRRYSARRPIANGKPNSFRSMRTYRDLRGPNNENARQQEEHDEMMGEYHKLQDIHSTVSSKDMVDMFLNSRRRPVETAPSVDKAEVFL
ncbi:uncharacterized protein N7498_010797 [Penicillium cinerascens]|uniref:Uncharacterized protein n=1 Tax=Penicillium cinerascens TaxID=70096 RepID=A0A9W9M992_9EURO|nr:uncharacterized protein N7498_010797 [Penicillium cinerascens]KAJ5191812.1 hypothetical protein N7498_010797 [Penicillium cinerascens]